MKQQRADTSYDNSLPFFSTPLICWLACFCPFVFVFALEDRWVLPKPLSFIPTHSFAGRPKESRHNNVLLLRLFCCKYRLCPSSPSRTTISTLITTCTCFCTCSSVPVSFKESIVCLFHYLEFNTVNPWFVLPNVNGMWVYYFISPSEEFFFCIWIVFYYLYHFS